MELVYEFYEGVKNRDIPFSIVGLMELALFVFSSRKSLLMTLFLPNLPFSNSMASV
jgi:hypothetical protein